MYVKDLSANVPLYGQEMCYWCGAASAQMLRNGYPVAADRQFYTQQDLWDTIQTHNSTDPADANWATDPHGLTGTMQSLSNPPGVNWVEFSKESRDAVLFDILYWMNRREFPCSVLVNQGGHWIDIVGFTTDVEPVAGSTPTLQTITVYDPEPHNVGTISTLTAAQWFAGYWNGAIIYGGTWLDKYVAVVEPPPVEGRVRVKEAKRVGSKTITASQAVEAARKAVKTLGLARQDRYALLASKDAVQLPPLLVRESPPRLTEGTGPLGREAPQYYVVPFGLANEATRDSPPARVCVLVNAFTGAFEEVTAFGKPFRFLGKEQALKVVASAMRVEPAKLARANAFLMFQPSDITHVRTFPFWRVEVGKRVVYVDQLGRLYGKLQPSIPGD